MNNLRRRKFNTYYWTCIVIAMCTLLSSIEWQTILAFLLGATLLPFYILDERGKYAFEDGESND